MKRSNAVLAWCLALMVSYQGMTIDRGLANYQKEPTAHHAVVAVSNPRTQPIVSNIELQIRAKELESIKAELERLKKELEEYQARHRQPSVLHLL